MITTQKELRDTFWQNTPQFTRKRGKKQNDYPCDVRVTWCDFVELLRDAGEISDKLAERATL